MMTSKYIGFFLKEISAWQKTLGVVDTVILLIIVVIISYSHICHDYYFHLMVG